MPVMDPPVAGEQPQLSTQTVPAGGEQPQRQEPTDFSSVIDGMTNVEDIGDILFDRVPEPADAEPAGPASGEDEPQAAPEAPAEDPDGTMPQDASAAAEDPPAEPTQAPSLDRISLRSLHPDDRLLVAQAKELVREGKAPRLADAFRMLTDEHGTPEPSPQAQQPAADAPQPVAAPAQAPAPSPEPDPDVAGLASQLADLRAQRKAAVEEFDRPTELELTSQIEDALALLAEAKSQAIYRNRETALQEQTVNAVIEEIYVAHPDSEDPKSFFSYRLTQEVADYEQAHGPIGRHPAQLRQLAAKVAQEIAPRQETKPQAAPAPAPRQNARPLGSSAPGSASAARPSPDNIQRLIASADEETLRAALFGAA